MEVHYDSHCNGNSFVVIFISTTSLFKRQVDIAVVFGNKTIDVEGRVDINNEEAIDTAHPG